MTKVKCNASFCKHNIENECTLPEIQLFVQEECEHTECDNFEAKEEIKTIADV